MSALSAAKIFQTMDLVASAPSGMLLDWFGPRYCHVAGQLMLLVAAPCMFFPALTFWGMAIQGASIQFILNSTLSVANLLSRGRNVAMSVLYATCDLATALLPAILNIMPIIDGKPDYRGAYNWTMGIISATAVVGVVVALLVLKDCPYEPLDVKKDREAREALLEEGASPPASTTVGLHGETFSTQARSREYWLFAVCWATMCFRVYYYIDTNMEILAAAGDTDKAITNACSWLMPLGFLAGVMTGVISDTKGPIISTAVVNVLCMMMNLASCSSYLSLHWIAMISFALGRGALCTVFLHYIAEVFGFAHLGVLYGFTTALVGVGSQVLVPTLYRWEAGTSFRRSSWTLFVIGLLVTPILMYLAGRVDTHRPPQVRRPSSKIARAAMSRKFSTAAGLLSGKGL